MDLQVTLGIILLVWSGLAGAGFPMFRIEHATTMIIAAVLGHLPARWKTAADSVRFRNTLFCILGALLLVYVGVMRLPGGWSR
jgi:multisubunit Na+/H+ antiporter MnhB subunit